MHDQPPQRYEMPAGIPHRTRSAGDVDGRAHEAGAGHRRQRAAELSKEPRVDRRIVVE